MTTNKAQKALTAKQRRFVDEYLVDFNATQAAIRAGHSQRSAASIGSENLRKPEIQTEINRRLDSIMPKAEILGRLAQQARSTMQDFFFIGMEERTIEKRRIVVSTGRGDDGGTETILEETEEKAMRPAVYLSLVKAQNLGKMHLIKKYSTGPKGESIELYNAQDALTTLGKYHAMWVDRAEVTGEDGGPIEISEIVVKKNHEPPPALDDD
ncbi:terminase small subunit [Herpetosiphon llansteffanensis]